MIIYHLLTLFFLCSFIRVAKNYNVHFERFSWSIQKEINYNGLLVQSNTNRCKDEYLSGLLQFYEIEFYFLDDNLPSVNSLTFAVGAPVLLFN